MKRSRRWLAVGAIAALLVAATFLVFRKHRSVASSLGGPVVVSDHAAVEAAAVAAPTATVDQSVDFFGRSFPVLAMRVESDSERAWLIDTGAPFGRVRIEERVARDPVSGAVRIVALDAFVAGQIIVTPRAGVTRAELDEAFRRVGAVSWAPIPASPQWLLHFAETSLDTKPAALAVLAGETAVVEAAEGNGIGEGAFVPNDASFSSQYSLRNTGQSGGAIGADVRMTVAWDVVSTSPGITVAVIDSGFTFSHPDLAANAYTDSVEIAGNGIDDDGNGFIDDAHGWDFVNSDNDPTDDHDHGSHVSGIIGAVGNNGTGIAGVTWSARILPVKVLNSSNLGDVAALISGVNYARAKHARVMNISLVNYPLSAALQSAITGAESEGVLLCVSAGNRATNNDTAPNYPSSYANLNIIAVANSTHDDVLNSGSSFGATSVDLAAPGSDVFSTVRNGYAYLTGTSMSAPHVTGIAALLLARRPGASAIELRDWILGSVDVLPLLSGKCATGGRLNAYAAMQRAGVVPPSLSGESPSQNKFAGESVSLNVTATAHSAFPLSYQWRLDGVAITGATSATYALPSAQRFHAGTYSVVVTSGSASATSSDMVLVVNTPASSGARVLNFSTRGQCLTGDDLLIVGFVVGGTGSKHTLIRAVGPGLSQFGVSGVLVDPQISLVRQSDHATVASNNNWEFPQGGNTVAEITAATDVVQAFPLSNASADSALLVDLAPGSYSVVSSGVANSRGVTLAELYDADTSGGGSRLINISTRGLVGTGASIMIPGFVVSSEGAITLLIRAVGPSLATFNVPSPLADPRLTIFRGQSAILSNDNWQANPDATNTASVSAQVSAFALSAGSKDAALVVTLEPGIYTVQVSGTDGETGVALVEIYVVP